MCFISSFVHTSQNTQHQHFELVSEAQNVWRNILLNDRVWWEYSVEEVWNQLQSILGTDLVQYIYNDFVIDTRLQQSIPYNVKLSLFPDDTIHRIRIMSLSLGQSCRICTVCYPGTLKN